MGERGTFVEEWEGKNEAGEGISRGKREPHGGGVGILNEGVLSPDGRGRRGGGATRCETRMEPVKRVERGIRN